MHCAHFSLAGGGAGIDAPRPPGFTLAMNDDISLLRDEVTDLRAELQALRRDHQRLLDRLFEESPEPGEQPPEFMNIAAECVAVRNDPKTIPILMRARENGAFIALLDDKMRHRAELSIGADGARFEMHNAEGKLIFQIAEAKDGSGQMCVCDAAGQPRAGLRVNESGGVVNVIDPAGKPQAFLLGSPAGGEVFAVNAMHKAAVTMKATDRGGMVCVHEPSGQLMGYLAANTETGAVGVHGSHGARACLIGSDANGGVVQLYDIDGEFLAKLPATEDSAESDEPGTD